eukprot:gene8149-11030_t
MSLWVDKHRPTSLQKLSLHAEVTNKLRSLAASAELPHLLFYGPPGAGKKTRVMALLREIYGVGVERVRLEHQMFKTTSGKSIEIITLGSNYHVECNPSDAGTNDRFVIQEVIKEIASHSNLATVGSNASKAFKIVLLTEVDRLSKQAQAGLRRTMEKYSSQCRIILLCNSPSKIIEPVRSRCLGIRIPAPNPEDIADILISTAKKEGCVCPYDLAIKISLSCDRNLRRALLMVETSHIEIQSTHLSSEQSAQRPDWELYIGRIARDILQEQSPSRLLQVRDMLYELLTNCIPADVILSNLSKELMKCLDDTLKHEVSYWVAYYDHRLSLGAKHIFHLEAFVAKFMSIYKRWLISFFG